MEKLVIFNIQKTLKVPREEGGMKYTHPGITEISYALLKKNRQSSLYDLTAKCNKSFRQVNKMYDNTTRFVIVDKKYSGQLG